MFRFGDPGGYPYGTAANLLTWWTSESHFTAAGGESIVSNGSRLGTTNALRLTVGPNASGGNWCYIWKTFDNQATWGIAFAFKTNVLTSTGIMIFNDGSTNQVYLSLASDGSLTVYRGGGTSLGSAPAGTVVLNTWIHIELKATINNSTGTIYLGINGTQVLNLTSQNTRATSNNYANAVYIGPTGPPGNTSMACDFCDIIIYDGQTTDPQGNTAITGPIGDCSLTWIQPNGAGTTTQWTPDSGSNYARVNESTPDGDTSYVYDTTINDIDIYTLADLASSVSSVKAIAAVHYSRKDDSGTKVIAPILRTSSTNYVHANNITLSTSYGYSFANWDLNPNTTSAWTKSDINALELGQKVIT